MALSAVSGSVGSLAAGHYVDKSKKFKEVIKGCYVGLAVAAISINAVGIQEALPLIVTL